MLEARARAEALASDLRWRRGAPLGLLDGIPVVWKDLFDVQGTSTTAGSELLRNAPMAAADAPAVQKLAQAGMVSVGKVGMSEFAYSGLGLNPHYGTPANPCSHDGDRAPGGSSSGSAVAVKLGVVPVGMGSDTGGSLRVPAAFQGLVGYRPSSGRFNKEGVYPLSTTLDEIGPIARNVQDCALIDAALRGQPTAALTGTPAGQLHVIVPTNLFLGDAEPEVLQRFSELLERLMMMGVRITHQDVPELEEVHRVAQKHGTIAAAEAYAWHRQTVDGPDASRIDRRVLSRLQRGRAMSADDLAQLRSARERLIARVHALLKDAWLLMPTVLHVAPLVDALEGDDELFNELNLRTMRHTVLGNFLDLCGISFPMGTGKAGMPVGALLSGPARSDAALFAAAATME
jgi:aspartyl-tRNA(Asn)/glutamyl-tRNA(Gln) amidotransferase subunit A